MNVTLPGNPALDIASTTGQGLASYAAPAEVLIGILLAFSSSASS